MPLPTRADGWQASLGNVVFGPDGTLWPYPLSARQREDWLEFEAGRRLVCSLCHQVVEIAWPSLLPFGCYAVPGCAVAEAERVRRHG